MRTSAASSNAIESQPPRSWQDDAACRELPIELFFPSNYEPVSIVALAACRSCPVRAECLEAGLDEHHGIWGGMSEAGRKAERRRRRGT